MRNQSTPTLETVTQWRDPAGALWCAQMYYPLGKRKDSRYFIASLSMVGTTISIPCASVAQLWHEVSIRQQPPLQCI
jgi:hypothetical protein